MAAGLDAREVTASTSARTASVMIGLVMT